MNESRHTSESVTYHRVTKSAEIHRCIYSYIPSCCLINIKILDTKYRCLYSCIPSCCLIKVKILDTKYRCLYHCMSRDTPLHIQLCTVLLPYQYQILDTKYRCLYSCIPSCCLINFKMWDTKYLCMYRCISVTKSAGIHRCINRRLPTYGVATISRMLKNIGLFCKRALQKRLVFCKETCIFKHPTHRSHPILPYQHQDIGH